MIEMDERHARNPIEDLQRTAAEAAAPEGATESEAETRTPFTSSGPLPPVQQSEATYKPTASELGYEENLAGPDLGKTPARQPGAKVDAKPVPQLLLDFQAKFPEPAKLIQSCPRALQHVRDAQAAGATFGGYTEDGPSKDTWPYTLGTTVYIPKAHSGMTAMADFLFELNNAMRAPQFNTLHKEAYKGDKGTLTRESFARQKIAIEVEGMLNLGEVWLASKTSHKKLKDKQWAKHDDEFYLGLYQQFKAGKITKDDIIDSALNTPYTEGSQAGKTPLEVYGAQYDGMAAFSKLPKSPGDDKLIDPSKE